MTRIKNPRLMCFVSSDTKLKVADVQEFNLGLTIYLLNDFFVEKGAFNLTSSTASRDYTTSLEQQFKRQSNSTHKTGSIQVAICVRQIR